MTQPRIIAVFAPVTCGASHTPDQSHLWLEDADRNRIELPLPRQLATRLHETWAATALPAPMFSTKRNT